MTTYYVGDETLFQHRELDVGGGPMAPQAGVWSVSNPLVAQLIAPGRVRWLAAGESDVLYVIPAAHRAGALHAVVHSAIPATLAASPDPIALEAGSLTPLTVTALDALSTSIPDLVVDSFAIADDAIASVVPIGARECIVIGKAEGATTLTITAGPATLDVAVTIAAFVAMTQAAADARYRRLSVLIPDSEVTKTPSVALGDVSGALALPWTIAARAKAFRLIGDTVATLSDLPVGEFAFFDVEQDTVGGRSFHLLIDAGLPPQEWDEGEEPVQTPDANRRDSYMAYNDRGLRVVCSRTWENVPTT